MLNAEWDKIRATQVATAVNVNTITDAKNDFMTRIAMAHIADLSEAGNVVMMYGSYMNQNDKPTSDKLYKMIINQVKDLARKCAPKGYYCAYSGIRESMMIIYEDGSREVIQPGGHIVQATAQARSMAKVDTFYVCFLKNKK
jgi:hypothetical protein